MKRGHAAGQPRSSWTAGILAAALIVVGCQGGTASAAEIDDIVAVLALEDGSQLADVGAGDGEWTVELASRVGRTGHVWATEVDPDNLESIERRVAQRGLENVTVVLGDQNGTGLPDKCCDAILLRLVYHHFEHPATMRASLIRALRPGGRVVVIDIAPQASWRDLPNVPDRGGHGIPPDVLVREMTSDGFRVVENRAGWHEDPDRFCVVFER